MSIVEPTTDRERLIAIESILNHLTDTLKIHTQELRDHIRDETIDFTDLKAKLALHLNESEAMMKDVEELKEDVSELKNERMKIIGWVAGAVFIIGIGWILLDSWLDHRPQAPRSHTEATP